MVVHFSVVIYSSVLPVNWEQFIVVKQGKTARLDWQISREIDHDYFTVEWGRDGQRFEPLGTVRSAEWRQGATAGYDFVHETPAPGNNYYRIRQTDFDGAYSFSNIEHLTFSGEEGSSRFSVFPNPAREMVRLNFFEHEGGKNIELLTMSGKLLRTVWLENTATQADIQLDDLPAGAYLIRAAGEVKRLIKR